MPFPPHVPVPATAPSAPDAVRGQAELPLRAVTLLVVEDSRFACDALRLICIRLGARLRRTETLASARAYLAAHRPDAVVVDLGLPDGRGEDLIAEVVRLGLPVIATSGDPQGRDPALRAGAGGFLEKPVSSVASFAQLVLGVLRGAATPEERDAPRPAPDGDDRGPPAADPLAFRDDLARASALIDGVDRLYAAGFLRSLGRAAGDQVLEDAARAAASDTGRADLARLVAARLERPLGLS